MKTYTTQFIFNIPKEDKKYLVIQNLRYSKSTVTIENHKINPVTTHTIGIILIISAFVIFITIILVIIFCKKFRESKTTSNKIDYKKEGPSPSNEINNSTEDQVYSSTQSNPQNGLFPPQQNYYSGGEGIYQTGYTN